MTTVWVADDEYDLARTLRAVLEAEGYRVETFGDGRAVLERLRGERPALVLLDVMMPVVSGLEVLRAMKASAGMDGIPVALMSAVTPRVRREDFRWDVFLRKPFSVEDLIRTVLERAGEPADASGTR